MILSVESNVSVFKIVLFYIRVGRVGEDCGTQQFGQMQ
jgi:hypothetical protein